MPSVYACAETGDVATLEILYSRGAPVADVDCDGITPMIVAAAANQPASIRFLLRVGVDHRHAAKDGTTPLHAACANGAAEAAKVLIAAGASTTARDEAGRSPAFLAIANGHVDTIAALSAWNVPLCATDAKGHAAAVEAARAGHCDALAALAEHAPSALRIADEACGLTPLVAAALAGHADAVRTIVTRGKVGVDDPCALSAIPVLARRLGGSAPTHHAAGKSAAPVPVDPADEPCTSSTSASSSSCVTPLIVAAACGHEATVRTLVELGADVERTTGRGVHAVAAAVAFGHPQVPPVIAEAVSRRAEFPLG